MAYMAVVATTGLVKVFAAMPSTYQVIDPGSQSTAKVCQPAV